MGNGHGTSPLHACILYTGSAAGGSPIATFANEAGEIVGSIPLYAFTVLHKSCEWPLIGKSISLMTCCLLFPCRVYRLTGSDSTTTLRVVAKGGTFTSATTTTTSSSAIQEGTAGDELFSDLRIKAVSCKATAALWVCSKAIPSG